MNPDVDCNGSVNVVDLMGLLSFFGEVDEDLDGIWDSNDDCVCPDWVGCTDPAAFNFDPDVTEDDGSCVYGGPDCGNQGTLTFDGYEYDLVTVGNRCWFVQNLRTTVFANGDSIPLVWSYPGTSNWPDAHFAQQPARTHRAQDTLNTWTYGHLYNWHALGDQRGICPTGWHPSTDAEWVLAEAQAGLPLEEWNAEGFRGVEAQIELAFKASPNSPVPWNGTNELGLEIVGGGGMHTFGYPLGSTSTGYYWTLDTLANQEGWMRYFNNTSSGVYRSSESQGWGGRVRCVKDLPASIAGCTDINAGNFNPEATENDGSCWYFDCNGASLSYHGYDYELVNIAGKCWFADNLRTTTYSNGDEISEAIPAYLWEDAATAEEGAYCPPESNADYVDGFGLIYNGYVTIDPRNVCPEEWRVTTDEDWNDLEAWMDDQMPDLADNDVHGWQLKSSAGDTPPWNGDNTYGLSLVHNAFRFQGGQYGSGFEGFGITGYYWTSTTVTSAWVGNWNRFVWSDQDLLDRSIKPLGQGAAIRCVRD